MGEYPTIHFLLRHRAVLVVLATALFPLCGIYAAFRTGYAELAFAGIVAGAVVYLLIRSYIELVDLIADMMLPK